MDDSLAAILSQLGDAALDCGFTRAGKMDTATIKIRTEVRDTCATDKCHLYGKNWSCPPACGSLEECEKKLKRFSSGLILQTTGSLEDSFDYESIERLSAGQNEHLRAYQKKLELILAPDRQWLLLGSGGCRNCDPCTYPELPCRFPDKMIVSVEAMGIVVSDLCRANNILYYYGPNTLTYTGCLLI